MGRKDVDVTEWYGPDAATFGDRVAAAREAAGMDVEALAIRLGVRQSTIRKWEDDVSEPRANRLSILAGLLNVSMRWLIIGEGEGLDAPTEEPVPADLSGILAEMRTLRMEMHAKAEAMGRLEKRLRGIMRSQEQTDV
ncbi:transcriptional regulator [Sulfitobacter sp. SK012]|uniref:helix-turn-helix domain-containing protein n=1 Tax=Sulfitobacter sp. SK012 TaxID=1389005 RepID=UPI000E0C7DBA|nr:helix-turn-helix transcriptional regulator [Sulfitobacter sp. SK012]AXI47445.1 transcriptional regulator [Sulfitobacter sp. SK012]